jgi:hypothetical protein
MIKFLFIIYNIYNMSIFLETILLLLYLITLFYFQFPDISNNNYLFHKLIIFVSTLVFKFAIELYKNIKENKKVDPIIILQDSIHYSLYNILGYSFYIDLMYMNIPYENMFIDINSYNQRIGIASSVMALFISSINFTKSLF